MKNIIKAGTKAIVRSGCKTLCATFEICKPSLINSAVLAENKFYIDSFLSYSFTWDLGLTNTRTDAGKDTNISE